MRTLLIGLAVGGLCGFALQRFVLTEETGSQRQTRDDYVADDSESAARGEEVDAEALRARIRELEALVKRLQGQESEDFIAGLPIARTDEEQDTLLETFERTGDLDQLLALIHSLLLQGEAGYPRLTRVLLRVIGRGMAGGIKEDDMLQRVVPAFKLALRHEKALVGYVGYLLTAEGVPSMLQTGAMGAAMFLSVNRVPGTEAFAPKLLEQFTSGAGAGGLFGDERERMLVEAMGFLQQKDAVDPLLAVLKDPQKSNLHRQAVQALGRIRDPRVVGTLLQRLQNQPADPNNWWNGSAELEALGRIGTEEATAAAETYLSNLTSDDVFFGQVNGYLRARPSDKVVGMVRARFRANPGSRNLWGAVYALRNAGTPEAVSTLEEIAATATDSNVKRNAQRFLDERKRLAEEAAAVDRGG